MFAVVLTVTFLERLGKKRQTQKIKAKLTRYPELVFVFGKKGGSHGRGDAGKTTAHPGDMKDMKAIGARSQHEFSKRNPACQT